MAYELEPVSRTALATEAEQYNKVVLPSRNNFVPALPVPTRIEMPVIQLATPATLPQVTPTATAQTVVTGSHDDRAKAWLRYSLPLCGAFGLVVLILIAVATPAFKVGAGEAFLRAVGVFFGVFVISYLGALKFYWDISPEGQSLRHTDNLWNYADREQEHRQAIEWEAWELTKAQHQKRLEG